MQTFLPFPNFNESARVLDRQRLGKQRAECVQMIMQLLDPEYANGMWHFHCANLMWRNHIVAICSYGMAICEEWKRQGYVDNTYDRIAALSPNPELSCEYEFVVNNLVPYWFGYDLFHCSHRTMLLTKDPGFYKRLFPNDLPIPDSYFWPYRSKHKVIHQYLPADWQNYEVVLVDYDVTVDPITMMPK